MDTIRRLEDHGASAVVLFSLFEEQIRHDRDAMEHFMDVGTESFGEALSYFPEVDDYDVGPAQYLELIRKASAAVDIPIIASLNGVTERGWVDFAKDMQDAGANGHRAERLLHPDRDVPDGRSRSSSSTSTSSGP